MTSVTTDQNRKPNVIWIFGDQHRGQALGCAGDPNAHTPNMDNLAASGMHFTGAVSGIPLCCPYRGSLLTGLYPHLAVRGHEHQLSPDQPTIAHILNDAGYDTAYFGKWHLDGFHEREGRAAMHIIPPERRGGFHKWIGYENNNSQWDCWVHGGEGDTAFQYRLPGYETDELTNLFLDYLGDRAQAKAAGDSQPFFAVLSVQPPHDPYIAPTPFRNKYNAAGVHLRPNVPNVSRVEEQARKELAGYYAMIENWDWNVGRIVDSLRESGLLENTHILFFGDHGDMHGSHGQFRKTCPWEEAVRIPMIISGENSFYGRRTGSTNVPLNHVDIAPTTLGLCGINKPEWMQGTDLSSLRLPGRPHVELPDSAYLQLVEPTRHGNSVDRAWRGLVTTDGWKYVCLENTPWLMFKLNEDPYEQVNLAFNSLYATERKRLNHRLRMWVEDTGDQFELPIL